MLFITSTSPLINIAKKKNVLVVRHRDCALDVYGLLPLAVYVKITSLVACSSFRKAFSSPEPTILLVCTRDPGADRKERGLWRQECAKGTRRDDPLFSKPLHNVSGLNILYIALYTGPPLVILEFVPHGDLLGYLKKSKGETDDYYNLKSAEVSRKIPKQQLYKFACDIARGMEFISAHQVSLLFRGVSFPNIFPIFLFINFSIEIITVPRKFINSSQKIV